jgi:glycosyltransferase involved in cell wall biosynthesis
MDADRTRRTLRILGTRGIPAAHGGFETFAEHLSLYLVARGWRVVVYCQEDGSGPVVNDVWRGVERIRIPIALTGAKGTVLFDWRCIAHAAGYSDPCLTLGYNTAVFCLRLRWAGVPNVINMDGIEWRRDKWGSLAKAWFWFNDWAGCWIADHLVADHPEIAAHLQTRTSTRRITTIPYGALPPQDTSAEPLQALGLAPQGYLTLIARPEPENSILEAVRGFSCRQRGLQLIVLGDYCDSQGYHRAIQEAASDEVQFLGAQYDPVLLGALRAHSLAHVHGHQVGGTNPSLVEALGAGNAIFAHDNRFNRWVAADAAVYFCDGIEFDQLLTSTLRQPVLLARMRQHSRVRHAEAFRWEVVLAAYEGLLLRAMSRRLPRVAPA